MVNIWFVSPTRGYVSTSAPHFKKCYGSTHIQKKDGSPSGFAKLLKGAAKVVGKVAPFLPVPASVATVVNKVMDKVGNKTGLAMDKIKIGQGETLGDLANRAQVGAGSAAAAFVENADNPAPAGVQPLVFGFAKEKMKKIALISAAVVAVYWGLKKFRIL